MYLPTFCQAYQKSVLSADLLPNSTLLEICLRQPGYRISDQGSGNQGLGNQET